MNNSIVLLTVSLISIVIINKDDHFYWSMIYPYMFSYTEIKQSAGAESDWVAKATWEGEKDKEDPDTEIQGWPFQ